MRSKSYLTIWPSRELLKGNGNYFIASSSDCRIHQELLAPVVETNGHVELREATLKLGFRMAEESEREVDLF